MTDAVETYFAAAVETIDSIALPPGPRPLALFGGGDPVAAARYDIQSAAAGHAARTALARAIEGTMNEFGGTARFNGHPIDFHGTIKKVWAMHDKHAVEAVRFMHAETAPTGTWSGDVLGAWGSMGSGLPLSWAGPSELEGR